MSSADLKLLPKLKPAIKKRWLKALRSGKYQQARGVLCRVDDDGKVVGMCCLGVLADVVKNDKGLKLKWEPTAHDTRQIDGNEFGVEGKISGRVVDDPLCIANFSPLAQRNDGNGGFAPKSFKQIAKLIETHC